jgi:CHASE3 domain sensor protein
MRNLAVRVTLAVLFVVACGVAAYLLWINESRARRDSEAFRTFDAAALAAARDVLELRAAQQAYVAAGQGEAFWIEKAGALTAALRDAMPTLRGSAASPDAQSSVDTAASALQDFEQIDRRARDYARSGQRLLASDLIFADGLETTAAIAGSIDRARANEAQARLARVAAARRMELAAVAGTAGIGLVAVLLLMPRATAIMAPTEVTRADERPETELEPAPRVERFAAAEPAPAPAAPAPSVDFNTVARVCGDLARVVDTRALPAILERAAGVLDAPGIVVWIADPDGRELTPIVTHGYPAPMVTRLGTIRSDAPNATASAFRTSLMQTVRTDAVSNGAIAAPLVTTTGCVGVMAAEVRHEGEKDSAKLAAAAIVAAQLATLVGPPSTRAHARTEAV